MARQPAQYSSSQRDKPQKLTSADCEEPEEIQEPLLPAVIAAPGPEHEREPHQRQKNSRNLLLSDHDLNRLATYSQRARNNSSSVSDQIDRPLKEFTSYFRSTASSGVPILLVSSHEAKRQPVLSLYPSLVQQSLRWNSSMDFAGSQQDIEPQESTCCCNGCNDPKCPYRSFAATALKNSIFKDNIMTFCDQFTMTPKVNDVSCGICLGVQPTHTRSVDVTTGPYMVSEECLPPFLARTTARVQHQPQTPSILKHHDTHDCEDEVPEYFEIPERKRNTSCELCDRGQHLATKGIIHEEESDESCVYVHNTYNHHQPTKKPDYRPRNEIEERPKISRSRTSVNPHKTRSRRKMLYNEGISDSVASNFLPSFVKASRKPSPLQLGVIGREYVDTGNAIPFSHKNSSRYHHDCKRSPNQTYRAEVESDHLDFSPQFCPRLSPRPSPMLLRKSSPPNCRANSVSIPKKLLISEKNIDAYIENDVKCFMKDNDDDY